MTSCTIVMHLSPFALLVDGILVIRQIVKSIIIGLHEAGMENAAGGVSVIIFTFLTCNINCPCLLFLFAD